MIRLEIVESPSQKEIAKNIVEKHHSYVPTYKSVGRRIDYLIYDDGEVIGLIGAGSSVYPPPKDLLRELALTKFEYARIFNQIANNWRFCFSVRRKNAGSSALSIFRRQLALDWKKKYGDELLAVITFVGGGHDGAVYKADNWKSIGFTAGLPKHKSSSMKWNTTSELKSRFVKPTGEDKKIIFLKIIGDLFRSKMATHETASKEARK